MTENTKIGAIILAAGHGTRMKNDLPKVMHKLKGKPLVEHVVDNVIECGCCEKPVVVVSAHNTLVQDHLGDKAVYAVQEEQLGTGHAVLQAKDMCEHNRTIMVFNADVPNISKESIGQVIETHEKEQATITLTSGEVSDFLNWREAFLSFGKILRDKENNVIGIKEYKDATDQEKNIKELNGGIYCFDKQWLWKNLQEIKNTNAQKEYYLTDLIDVAIKQGKKVCAVKLNAKEIVGISTQDDLARAETLA